MANQIILDNVGANTPVFTCVSPASCANGYFVVLGALGSAGTYTVAAPGAVTDAGMVMVLDVPLSYEAQYTEDDYVITTGKEIRCYAPYVGMKVSIPVANVTATAPLAAGTFVVPDAGQMKPENIAALGGTEEVQFIVEKLFTKAGVSMVKIRCIKAY